MRKNLLFLLMAILSAFTTWSQYSVQGKLTDFDTRVRIRGASVSLKSAADASYSRYAITDTAGRFSFSGVPSGNFDLAISYIGYSNNVQRLRVDSGPVTLDSLRLSRNAGLLDSVTVLAKTPMAEQKGDTIQLNASQFKVNPDATVEDLAKKMPGITVENGQVKAQGENVQKVTLDGRDFFGDDATAALRNLPAEIVDKIQVFDRQSDQAQFTGFDDGNTSKSLNIVTKASMRNGQYGRVFAGYGSDGHYQAGGNTTLLKNQRKISFVGNFNNINQQNFSAQDLLGVTNTSSRGGGRGGGGGGGGNSSNFLVGQQDGFNRTSAAGVNYTDNWGPKLVFTGSYFFNDTRNTTSELVDRTYVDKTALRNSQSSTGTRDNSNHRINMRFEYKIDSANQLIITPTASFQGNHALTRSISGFYDPATSALASKTDNLNDAKRNGYNINNSILYRHAFAKRGRTVSLNLTTGYNNRTGEVYSDLYDSTYSDSTMTDSISRRFTDQSNNGLQLSANVVYTEPVGKNSQLQANYNTSYNRSRADQEAFLYDETDLKYSIFNPQLSSKFTNNNTGQNAGVGYRYGTKTTQLNIGVNYQRSDLNSDAQFPRALTVDKTFYNVLPNAMLRMKFDDRNSIRLMYRASTTAPSVTQLQDVYDPTNPPYFTAGNPNLSQQVTQTLNARYTYTNTQKSILIVGNIYYQAASNYITNATFIADRDSVLTPDLTLKQGWQLTKPVNLDGYNNLRALLTFAIPLTFMKSNINVTTGITNSKLPGFFRGALNSSKNLTYSAGAVIASNISQYVDFNINYNANISTVKNKLDPGQNNQYFSHTAGIQFNLLTKTGWFLQNDLTNQLTTGYSEGFNQNYFLWNMGAGKKLFKKQQGELKVTVFDLLNQNRSITRNVNAAYIEDVQTQVIRQYFMLTFTYNLRNFGTVAGRGQGPGPGGFGPGGMRRQRDNF